MREAVYKFRRFLARLLLKPTIWFLKEEYRFSKQRALLAAQDPRHGNNIFWSGYASGVGEALRAWGVDTLELDYGKVKPHAGHKYSVTA